MSSSAPARELAGGKLLVDEPVAGVTRLTISNPAKRNALDHPILDAITATLGELTGARCVIITGAHEMFSAGYDIGEIPEEEFEERAERLVAHPFTEAIDALEAFPFPTLASLPGHTIGGGLERRFASDRVSAAGDAAAWIPLGGGAGFRSAGLRTAFRSSTAAAGTVFVARGGVEAASAAAPLALWPGAGDGHARTPLLRAHVLLHDGIIDGAVFGERVAYATGEVQHWIQTPPTMPMRIAVASFVDVARASRRAPAATGDPFQIDAGFGVRVKMPGHTGTLRIDAGHGIRDGANALTFGWQLF